MHAIWKAIIGVVGLTVIGVCGVQVVRFERESRRHMQESLRELTTLKPFRTVQSGRASATVSELALLEMLSADTECISNLASVTFASVAFRPSDGPRLSKLSNLVSIGFYDCDNVDAVIANCFGQQVHTISFETTSISKQSFDLLRNATSVKITMNGRSIREDLYEAISLWPF